MSYSVNNVHHREHYSAIKNKRCSNLLILNVKYLVCGGRVRHIQILAVANGFNSSNCRPNNRLQVN